MEIHKDQLGDAFNYLVDGLSADALYLDGEFLTMMLPASVQLKVTETEPGVRGNTVSNTLKAAKMETGLEVRVPLFINEGDVIKVDTRTGEYVERV